jgi:hypothetical protein
MTDVKRESAHSNTNFRLRRGTPSSSLIKYKIHQEITSGGGLMAGGEYTSFQITECAEELKELENRDREAKEMDKKDGARNKH